MSPSLTLVKQAMWIGQGLLRLMIPRSRTRNYSYLINGTPIGWQEGQLIALGAVRIIGAGHDLFSPRFLSSKEYLGSQLGR
ncbi:conserved hypothetical protein [Ricinus communis]|uniref:Uncharacterized protein n=1 Tax=Ricinus communis TaxID=3988 RepID=B9RRK1_RICCO|nr:conserved hypothetical protein [Ricinus communis]